MSALDLRLSFAAARAAVAMVAWLPLGCPLYGTASLRVTAGRLGTNECVLALPRVACAVQLGTLWPSKPYKRLVPLCYRRALRHNAYARKVQACPPGQA